MYMLRLTCVQPPSPSRIRDFEHGCCPPLRPSIGLRAARPLLPSEKKLLLDTRGDQCALEDQRHARASVALPDTRQHRMLELVLHIHMHVARCMSHVARCTLVARCACACACACAYTCVRVLSGGVGTWQPPHIATTSPAKRGKTCRPPSPPPSPPALSPAPAPIGRNEKQRGSPIVTTLV